MKQVLLLTVLCLCSCDQFQAKREEAKKEPPPSRYQFVSCNGGREEKIGETYYFETCRMLDTSTGTLYDGTVTYRNGVIILHKWQPVLYRITETQAQREYNMVSDSIIKELDAIIQGGNPQSTPTKETKSQKGTQP